LRFGLTSHWGIKRKKRRKTGGGKRRILAGKLGESFGLGRTAC